MIFISLLLPIKDTNINFRVNELNTCLKKPAHFVVMLILLNIIIDNVLQIIMGFLIQYLVVIREVYQTKMVIFT